MKTSIRVWACSAFVLFLIGCNSVARNQEIAEGALERPASELPATTEARSKSRIHVELGTAYMEAARYGTALDEAKIAIAYDSSYAPAHMLMGLVYSMIEQNQSAINAFQEAARLAPGDPEINNAFGWFLCSQGRESEGLARLSAAARNPYYRSPARAHTNAGLCNLRRNNDPEAEQHFLRALQVDRANVQALYHLAAIALRAGNLVRARSWLKDIQGIMPAPTAEILWLALRVERKAGDRVAESQYAARLKRDYPASDEYQAYLQGKFE